MSKSLNRAIKIAKVTGDRVIIHDSENDSCYVVMSLDKYEEMLTPANEARGLTEGDMVDKINSDIEQWKNDENQINERENFFVDDFEQGNEEKKEVVIDGQTISKDEMLDWNKEEVELDDDSKKSKNWKIPRERKASALEVVDDDKQYLEEIPF